uniref:UDP-glycosyltransferases domain-containing protein n=1 Tax=Cucumis sativus TaxID=3659 RepID=A0A0A0KZ87_CUCSA
MWNECAIEFVVPSFKNPIPRKVISTMFYDKKTNEWTIIITRKFREVSGFLVNTFSEIESSAINWLANQNLPPLEKNPQIERNEILKGLDEQPPSSGIFNKSQSNEIANALERNRVRFIWSIRQVPLDSVLPKGFVYRTSGMGKVMGWVVQMEILEHPATGGFVSHCGWNSVLESLWNGVAVATWPMYAEQQLNTFQMAVELGVGVEVSLDYSMVGSAEEELRAEKIDAGIRKLMEGSEEMKKGVMVKSEESKKATMEDGSSFNDLNRFIDHVFHKINTC